MLSDRGSSEKGSSESTIPYEPSIELERRDSGRRVWIRCGTSETELHPLWLRERTNEPGDLDTTNLQRLFDANDLDEHLTVTSCDYSDGLARFEFSDGSRMSLWPGRLLSDLGWTNNPEAIPAREPWTSSLRPFPYAEWGPILDRDPEALVAALGSFWRHGFFVLQNVPTMPDTLRSVGQHLGNIIPTNFGELFDVVTEIDPTDLAYTPIHLNAHSDGPYRKPAPGIQMLHCLVNDTDGGYSTLVDGFGASEELAVADPEAYRALTEVDVEFRYDVVSNVVINRTRILELDAAGEFKQIRFSHRLDYVAPADAAVLDAFYRGRRWLRDRMNNPTNQVQFLLAPGDVMVMDNHRLLHGRTAFDATKGRRHLQGCYIDHDGPDAQWRLACRALTNTTGAIHYTG